MLPSLPSLLCCVATELLSLLCSEGAFTSLLLDPLLGLLASPTGPCPSPAPPARSHITEVVLSRQEEEQEPTCQGALVSQLERCSSACRLQPVTVPTEVNCCYSYRRRRLSQSLHKSKVLPNAPLVAWHAFRSSQPLEGTKDDLVM